jgi:hypothetical protein
MTTLVSRGLDKISIKIYPTALPKDTKVDNIGPACRRIEIAVLLNYETAKIDLTDDAKFKQYEDRLNELLYGN